MKEKSVRVLLVDDEASFRNQLKKYLETQHTFVVVDLGDGRSAQANLRESHGKYDVALIDEVLEGEVSGFELLKWIKARYPHIEVIVFTTWGMENALNALRAGAYRYLTKPFNPEELALLLKLAAEMARLRDAVREKDVLSNLLALSTALLSGREEEQILEVALQAIHAIGFDRVRLYELQENGASMRARAHVGMDDRFLQAHWQTRDDDIMQQVLKDPQVYVFRRQPGEQIPYEDFLDKSDVDEWICAPLVVNGQVIGKLSADRKYSKVPITEAEKGSLALFTSIAALAVENHRLLSATRQRAEELEKLRKNTLAITANLDRDSLLKTIIQGAVELLTARRGGIYEYDPQLQLLTVVADFGHGNSMRRQTLKFGEGLAGRLMASQAAYAIIDDYACWPERSDHYDPNEFRAVLEVPLVWSEQRTGVLYVEDAEGRRFSEEDAHLLSRFADHAAIALEQSRRLAELTTTRDNYIRLIENSFDGIISIDMEGFIREFNSQAEKILDYRREQVIGQPVGNFYADPQEPGRVAKMLYTSTGGRMVDYQTRLKARNGQEIPVRLSATWLLDAHGQRSGSVGYFKDLRYIQQVERHRQLLLEANEAVARAESLEAGLRELAESMTIGCHSTFCAIYLCQPEGGRLEVKAAHPISRARQLAWDPEAESAVIPEQHRLFRKVAERGATIVLNADQREDAGLLDEIAENVHLPGKLSSALIVPLALCGEVRGMCVLGEMRNWMRQPFEASEIILVEALTKDAAALLEKMQLQELTNQQLEESERQKRLWEALAQSLRHIHPARERGQLQQEIVNQVADLMGYPYACLLVYHPIYAQLEVVSLLNLPEDLKGVWAAASGEPFGTDACEGEIRYLEDIAGQPWRQALFGSAPVHAALIVPFTSAGELVAVLVLGEATPHDALPADLEVLKRFSTQAVTALQTSKLIGSEKRKIAQLLLLHKISEYIQQPAEDLSKIFHAALTGVTADYGLGFNRAAILLVERAPQRLVGQKGIGLLDKQSAEQDWARYHQESMDDVNRYLEKLEKNELPSTPLDLRMAGLEIKIQNSGDDPFSEVIARKQVLSLNEDQVARLPDHFQEAFEPGASFTVAPLIARREVIGLLVADNKFTCMPATEDLLENLMTFANAIALAVDNAQMLQELKRGQSLQRALFEASGELLSALEPKEVLARIVSQARKAAEASWVSILLIREDGEVQDLVRDGIELQVSPQEIIRPNGITQKIVRTGKAELIHDLQDHLERVNPRMLALGVQAAAGLPVVLNGETIGVMWVHYTQPHFFTSSEIEALQLYANQAALAYDNKRRSLVQERMRAAVEELSRAETLEDAAAHLPDCFKSVLECESVAFFLYNERRKHFPVEKAWQTGVAEQDWLRLRNLPQAYEQSAEWLFRTGCLAVKDVHQPVESELLSPEVTRLLTACQLRSFQLLPLKAGAELLGFVLAMDSHPHPFKKEMCEMAQTFANHTALILNKALLMRQTQRAKQAVEKVAQVMTLGDFEVTKQLLTDSTREVVECDAVVLYTLDEETNILDHPPTMTGVWYPDQAQRFPHVDPESLVYKIINRSEPYYVVEDLTKDPFFRESRFAKDEDVHAVVAVPLVAYGNKKGIMFVNYRTPQSFSSAELNNINLFAHQAAIAVHNAKLFDKEKQRLKQLSDMYAELEKTRGIAGAGQALAWMGMISNTFRHSLGINIQTILDNLEIIIDKMAQHALDQEIAEEVNRINAVAAEVRSMPITAPLSEEEGAYPFSLSELLRERLVQKRDAFSGVTLVPQLESDDRTTVKADPQWVRRALDILLENAVEAMEASPTKILTVRAGRHAGRVEVRVSDTGPGIPEAIRPALFKRIIQKENREKGLGVGLLMAYMIFQTYQGDVQLETTGPQGTTMLCWLPFIQPDERY